MARLLALLAASCWRAALGLTVQQSQSADRLIGSPVPETFSDMLKRRVNTSRMVPLKEHGLRGGPDLVIMGYPSGEDVEISDSLNSTGGEWERFHLKALCNPWVEEAVRGNFLDVGANIGTYSIPMADCIKGKGEVISVEGMPSIADHFRAAVVQNDARNVFLYNYAVGGWTKMKHISMVLDPINKGGSSVTGYKGAENNQTGLTEIQVPLTNLDTILRTNPRMKALLSMKADIEGSEGHMMKGANDLFTSYPPCFLTMELIPDWLENANSSVDVVVRKLERYGYRHVPSGDRIRRSRWRSRTIHVRQKKLSECLTRVAEQYDLLALRRNYSSVH